MGRLRRWSGARLVQVLFGGTFDPVHNGHVAMAISLSVAFPDATIRVIPNRQPPHRTSRVSSAHRLAMLKLAMDEISGVTVDLIELGRDGPSYTVDTLRSLRAIYGEQESIVLALGADAVLVGQPIACGLAVGGAQGVSHVLRLLRDELEVTMALAGCKTLDEITPDRVVIPAPFSPY